MEGIIAEDPLPTFLVLVLLPLGLLILIPWSVLPFSAFGIKSRLNKMIEHMEEISGHQQLLIRLVEEMIYASSVSQDRIELHTEEEGQGVQANGPPGHDPQMMCVH